MNEVAKRNLVAVIANLLLFKNDSVFIIYNLTANQTEHVNGAGFCNLRKLDARQADLFDNKDTDERIPGGCLIGVAENVKN